MRILSVDKSRPQLTEGVAMSGEGKTFNISGTPVAMPAGLRPFPSQFAVMSKAITALKGGTNALLESRECAVTMQTHVLLPKLLRTLPSSHPSDWHGENSCSTVQCSILATCRAAETVAERLR